MANAAPFNKPKPQLKNLDGLFRLDQETAAQHLKLVVSNANAQGQDTYFTKIPFSIINDFPHHPFRLYEGKRKIDMVEDIRRNGIMTPLIIWEQGDGNFIVLSGHNRKYCGLEAGLQEGPALVHRNLTDDEAWAIVIHTNAYQRSFSELAPSEQATILSSHYSKMFSQGKRNDIIAQIKLMENPHSNGEKSTSVHSEQKSQDSRAELASEYGLDATRVARLLRMVHLIPELQKWSITRNSVWAYYLLWNFHI